MITTIKDTATPRSWLQTRPCRSLKSHIAPPTRLSQRPHDRVETPRRLLHVLPAIYCDVRAGHKRRFVA